jgi:hypothetical protein
MYTCLHLHKCAVFALKEGVAAKQWGDTLADTLKHCAAAPLLTTDPLRIACCVSVCSTFNAGADGNTHIMSSCCIGFACAVFAMKEEMDATNWGDILANTTTVLHPQLVTHYLHMLPAVLLPCSVCHEGRDGRNQVGRHPGRHAQGLGGARCH